MDYFTDVYLKRINRFGNNIQTRVHGKMENDFESKLVKSVNKVDLYDQTDKEKIIGVGILETKKINETEVVDYLCTRIDDKYDNGFIFYTIKPFFDKKQAWMILYQEQYETIGYNRYVVVLLESELKWIGRDGLFHTSCVHYVGEKDSKIKSNFKIVYDVTVNVPNKTLIMICPKTDFIYRNLKLNISNETWRISGCDSISIPGVMYVTLEEDYLVNSQYANEEELNKWSITSSQGLEIALTKNSDQVVDFYCTYNGTLVECEVSIKCDNAAIIPVKVGFNKYKFTEGSGYAKITASIIGSEAINQVFDLAVTHTQENWISIIGPNQIKVMQTLEYELATSLIDYNVDISSEKGNFVIDKIQDNKIYITGTNIGNDNIVVIYNGTKYLTPINVISSWM